MRPGTATPGSGSEARLAAGNGGSQPKCALCDRQARKPVTTAQGLLWDRPGNTAGSGRHFSRGCEACLGWFIHPQTDPSKQGSYIPTLQ